MKLKIRQEIDLSLLIIIEFILILRDIGFLAYKEYKYSVLPSNIYYYFRSIHTLSKEKRESIISILEKDARLVQDINGIYNVTIPSSFPYFFSELLLYTDGLACQDCLYIVRLERAIQLHYRNIYSWENLRTKGRVAKKIENSKKDIPWILNIYYQQFFRLTLGHSYFRVDPKKDFRLGGVSLEGASSREREVIDLETFKANPESI